MNTETTTYAEMAARIRATLAAHAQAQDDGRAEDLITLYTPDGVLDIPGMGTYEGTDALREAFASWKPATPQRHIVVNTVITSWEGDHAKATSDVIFIQRGDPGWAIQIVTRYLDTFTHHNGTWLLSRRSMQFIT